MLRSRAWLVGLALLAACNAPGRMHQSQLPGLVPPEDADFDSVAVAPPTCVGGWMISLVPHRGADPQWAVGPEGHPHIMYIGYGAGQTALRHVAEDTLQHADTVSLLGLGSLAIGPDGTANAFLAARSGMVESPNSVGIVHVSRAHGGWMLDPAQVSSDGGLDNASAIDDDGHAHLAFSDDTLFYASNASGQWVKTPIGTQTQVSVFKLEIDRSRWVHIWFNGTDPTTNLASNYWASNAGGAWQVVAVSQSDVVSAIDRHGVPHIVSNGGSSGGLLHLWYDGQGWRPAALPDLTGATAFDLRIDDNDKLHLVIGTPMSDLVYADNVGGTWRLEPVVNFEGFRGVPSARLGLDGNGQPHIAFKGQLSGANFGFAQRCP